MKQSSLRSSFSLIWTLNLCRLQLPEGTPRVFPVLMVDPVFVTCSLKSFGKVWCPFLLNQLVISWICNPLDLHINITTLPVNETFVCNRAEGYICVRKDRRGRLIMFLESEKKSYKRVTGHALWCPFVNLWVGRRMWVYWNGIMKHHWQVDHIITTYKEAGKETASLLKGIIHISLSLIKALCPFPLSTRNKAAQMQEVI